MPSLLFAGECGFINNKKFSERQALLWEKNGNLYLTPSTCRVLPCHHQWSEKENTGPWFRGGAKRHLAERPCTHAIRQKAEALITTPKEEKEAILTQLQKEVDDLILTASYYHLKKTHAESPVMMLKLLNQGDSTDPLFGFMTTKKKESLVLLPTVTRQSLYKGGAMCLFPDHKS